MKNLSKRNKIILAIVGVLVIAVAAIAVFAQAGGGELFGTTAIYITPYNPTIGVDHSLSLDDELVLDAHSVYNCNWSNSNPAVLSTSNLTGVKTVIAFGLQPGQSTITAKCGFSIFKVNSATTTVTVQ